MDVGHEEVKMRITRQYAQRLIRRTSFGHVPAPITKGLGQINSHKHIVLGDKRAPNWERAGSHVNIVRSNHERSPWAFESIPNSKMCQR